MIRISFPDRLVTALTLAFTLIACDGGSAGGTDVSGDQQPLLSCTNNQIPNANGTACVDKPIQCPNGQILDNVTQQCVQAPFDGPAPVYFPAKDEAVIYFNRQHIDQDYSGWVLHLWNDGCNGGWAEQVTEDSTTPTTWPAGPKINGAQIDPIYGAYWVLKIKEEANCGNWIVHDAAPTVQTDDYRINFKGQGPYARMAFLIADPVDFNANSIISQELPICIDNVCKAAKPPARAINGMAAHFVDATTLVWNVESADRLYAAMSGGMDQDEAGNVTGSDASYALTKTTLTADQVAMVPHLANWKAFTVDMTTDQAKAAAKGQMIVTGANTAGSLVGTGVQFPRLLDALYTMGEDDADEAELGVSYSGGVPAVRVWAPTAHTVELKTYVGGSPKRLATIERMTENTTTGIWSYTGDANLDRKFYRFAVQVYDYADDSIVKLETTDPYSVSTAERGFYSQFVNLADDDLKPAGWDSRLVPALEAPEKSVIYEGHIRDFSIWDASTSAANRGKYLAFTEKGSVPMTHLKSLQEKGLTHFHVLPSADFVTVDEVRTARVEITDTVERLCKADESAPVCDGAAGSATLLSLLEAYDPTTDAARKLMQSLRRWDGFNWGYDPHHYNVPEGSYSSDSDGVARIKEIRAMNMALNNAGLRVVMDVVYPHTSRSGLTDPYSTFDKIVPGYYFRRDLVSGAVDGSGSGAGSDTAAEHRMFGKFVVDSLEHWAANYGYSDFRFDQMTLMPKSVVLKGLEAVKAIRADTYFYGEGWQMGGLSGGDAIFESASQQNMAGTGVGTFNDVSRDSMRFFDLNRGLDTDRIRVGLAGNLKSFEFYNNTGRLVTADTEGAYNLDPQGSVLYVSKHDNETLWDNMQKQDILPTNVSAADRARIQSMTTAMPLLAQGVAFLHMGSELLRSKSMDRNTFDAGDWYNRVDFTKTSNNWAAGLPLENAEGQSDQWIVSQFKNPNTRVTAKEIRLAATVFGEFMSIASSSPLFSLETAAEVNARVGFHNTGPKQLLGVIAMSIDDGTGVADLDSSVDALMIVFNGNGEEKTLRVKTASGFALHEIQANSADSIVRNAGFSEEIVDEDGGKITYGIFTVPAYTSAVFVKAQTGEQGAGIDRFTNAPVAVGRGSDNPYGTPAYLRGINGDWGTSNPFIYNGDGTFSAYATLAAGEEQNLKFVSGDWSTINYGPNSASPVVALDTSYTMGAAAGELLFTPPDAGEYRFTVNALDANAPVLIVSKAKFDKTLYLRGINDDWSPSLPVSYTGRGAYRITTAVNAGEQSYKFAEEDWSNPNLGLADAGASLGVGGEATLEQGSNDNINTNFASTGNYVFSLDVNNKENPLAMLQPENRLPKSMYVRGVNGDWGASFPLTYHGGNLYEADIDLSSGAQNFKIASEDWSVEYTVDRAINLFEKVEMAPGGGKGNTTFTLNTDTSVNFTFDANSANPTLILKSNDS